MSAVPIPAVVQVPTTFLAVYSFSIPCVVSTVFTFVTSVVGNHSPFFTYVLHLLQYTFSLFRVLLPQCSHLLPQWLGITVPVFLNPLLPFIYHQFVTWAHPTSTTWAAQSNTSSNNSFIFHLIGFFNLLSSIAFA